MIKYIRIPRHNKILSNEMANYLTKKGAKLNREEDFLIGTSLNFAKEFTREWTRRMMCASCYTKLTPIVDRIRHSLWVPTVV